MDSCGPSSALTQLNKHAQRDQTLQNEFVRPAPGQNANAFQRPRVDHALNSEFERFQQDSFQPLNMDMQQFQHQNLQNQNLQNQHQNHQLQNLRNHQLQSHQPQSHQNLQLQNQLQNHQSQNFQGQNQLQQPNTFAQQFLAQNQSQKSGWVDDFHALSLRDRPSWNRQFMQKTPLTFTHAPVYTNKDTDMEVEDLGAQFDEVERELAQLEQNGAQKEEVQNEAVQADAVRADDDKERFAEAARQVQRLMLEQGGLRLDETSEKFAQLNFLKLMALISERQVEISPDGESLVRSNPERAPEPDYHVPPRDAETLRAQNVRGGTETVRESESSSVRAHLPDPLAHVRDGALALDLTPLQAARIISGGQVRPADWTEDESWTAETPRQQQTPRPQRAPLLDHAAQEAYDDYRNDDDFH